MPRYVPVEVGDTKYLLPEVVVLRIMGAKLLVPRDQAEKLIAAFGSGEITTIEPEACEVPC